MLPISTDHICNKHRPQIMAESSEEVFSDFDSDVQEELFAESDLI